MEGTNTDIEKRDLVISIAERILGKENVSTYREWTEEKESDHYILVRFPSLTVTNEKGNRHIITDVYVKIDTSCPYFCVTRTSRTKKEDNIKYIHSHIKPGLLGVFNACCLGRGPINMTLNNLIKDSYNTELWHIFFLELKQFLETESIEGGPYIYIRNIGEGSCYLENLFPIRKSNKVLHTTIYNTALRILKENKVSFVKINNGIYLKNDDMFPLLCTATNIFIEEYYKQTGTLIDSTNVDIYKRENWFCDVFKQNSELKIKDYRTGALNNSSNNNSELAVFYFKGERVPIRIVEEKEDVASNNVTVLSHTLFILIDRIIGRELNNLINQKTNFTNV